MFLPPAVGAPRRVLAHNVKNHKGAYRPFQAFAVERDNFEARDDAEGRRCCLRGRGERLKDGFWLLVNEVDSLAQMTREASTRSCRGTPIVLMTTVFACLR